MLPDFTSLMAVLTWLALAGGPYVVLQVLSLVAENWAKWHELPRWVKFFAPMVVSVLISVGANLLMANNAAVTFIDPYYRMIAVAVIAYLASQKAYMNATRSGYARQVKQYNE